MVQIYVCTNSICFTGKIQDICRQLTQYAEKYQTVQEFITARLH